MLRRLFSVASVLSLLSGVAILVLWPLSYCVFFREPNSVIRVHVGHIMSDISVQNGLAWVYTFHDYPDALSFLPEQHGVWGLAGLVIYGYDEVNLERQSVTMIRLWPVAFLSLALPAARFGPTLWSRVRAHRRRVANTFVSCGFNLTGNTSGTCPECGTKITPNPARSRTG
ncbi:MAG TPA: hypothetical protein VN541_16935 [Tepidisphaeraceae bacterium]|nr:hypothetical protein [Tepidisphaeraceae bacterium]